MRNATLLTVSCLLTALAAPALSIGDEFLLYTPKPSAGDQAPASPDQGVLVKKVKVKRGDTLSHLSKAYIGTASWFPQVLLFNRIKNPDLIYVGDTLLIPVHAGQEASVKKSRKHAGTKAVKHRRGRRRHAAGRPTAVSQPVAQPGAKSVAQPVKAESQPVKSGEQASYQHATQAYLRGDYQKALNLYGLFLQKFPHSRLAPDATLNQADCMMRLSAE
jgi:LysM repeat protein